MKDEFKKRIEKLAYSLWLKDNKPDGELFIKHGKNEIKIKELHWLKAELIAKINIDPVC